MLFFFGLKLSAQEEVVDPCNMYDLVILLDQSSSVDSNFNVACMELAYFFQQINIGEDAGHVAFVTFNNNASIIHYLSGNKESLIESARIMLLDTASGYTNLYSALQVAFGLLRESVRWQDSAIPKIFIVVTDGYPNITPEEYNPFLREGSHSRFPSLNLARLIEQQGVTIHVVSMGCNIDENFLRNLASSDGVVSYSDYYNLAKTLREINLCQ